MDSNVTRQKRKKEAQRNKSAFTEIFGDPILGIDGAYYALHNRSTITPIENKYGEANCTSSPAKPTPLDFFCDVYNVIRDTVSIELMQDFYATYFMGVSRLTKQQKRMIEQAAGKLLRQRGIYPVKRYFTVEVK